MEEVDQPHRSFRRHFQNWISWIGLLIAASAVFAFLFLFAIDLFATHSSAYVGILAYLVAPLFFLFGFVLAIIGAFLARRRESRALQRHEPLKISIDLSRRRDRRLLVIFAASATAFLFVTALGSYETYHYTESVEFCGQRCHVPMKPEFVTSQHGIHANVECVDCHVGPGAAAFFRTKLNGVKQLYHAIRDDYPRPIYVSEANPRPPQAICEQCHWPQRYVGNIVRSYEHYLSDEHNTPFAVRLLLNVGGGDLSNGPPGGIHWHMNIANKIEYIATDKNLETISWVRMTNPQGVVTEYRTPEFTDDPAKHQVRRMDCMDCHSRPAHRIQTPNDAVDHALTTGRLDRKTPWVKSKVVAALVKDYKTTPDAENGITASLREAYPDAAVADPIIRVATEIYHSNFFPEVKTDWRSHPDFVGHKNWNGCFRCHDGKHTTADGKASIKASDCRSCHLILAQGNGEQLQQVNFQGHNFFHIDSDYSDFSCAECHTGGVQK
ncbi:MAG TPA: NapC/NirT family cytochrome c [Chthoniobacterales bacterium]|nr:NapC/NirT family cytochrome c [Chthoniobacterales bacterium]